MKVGSIVHTNHGPHVSVVFPPFRKKPWNIFAYFFVLRVRTYAAFREMFWKELKNYFEHVDIEQRERLDGKLADGYDSYMSIRRYTTAVLVFCYVTQ